MLGNLLVSGGFCTDASEILLLVSKVLNIFKIVIPILLIIWGSVDLGKAVVAQKDEEIKKATQTLVKRAIAGVIIFFIPTIVGLIFGLVGDFQEGTEMQQEYQICADCIKNPDNCPQ